MEAITGPQGKDHWDRMGMRPVLEAIRGDAGEKMVLEDNFFIEEILPKAIIRPLTNEEMTEYRRPYTTPGEDRRPTLTWPRQIPIDGDPADVHEAVKAYADWRATRKSAKPCSREEPGAILPNASLIPAVRSGPNLPEWTLKGIHCVQEDSRDEIGQAVANWMKTLG